MLVLGIVKVSLKILGIGIGVKKSGIAHVCLLVLHNDLVFSDLKFGPFIVK